MFYVCKGIEHLLIPSNDSVMKRRQFVKALSLSPIVADSMRLNTLKKITDDYRNTDKMPVLFIGHGHPMNAILDNRFTKRLTALGNEIEKPSAVLVISAHWQTRGTYVSTNPWPKTIYDFGNFDDRLFNITYEPNGHPRLAREVARLIDIDQVYEDQHMGLDHGTWTVLKYIYPNADIPVFQLSMNHLKAPSFHFELGKQLKSLRNKGVLIIGSGNIVHNLGRLDWSDIDAKPHDWALEFDDKVKGLIKNRQFNQLVNYQQLGNSALLSIPTNDHYLPMLHTLGLADKEDNIEHIFEGYQYAGVSMRCFRIG